MYSEVCTEVAPVIEQVGVLRYVLREVAPVIEQVGVLRMTT